MGTTPTDSHDAQLTQSESTYQIDDLCNLLSKLLTDGRFPQELIIEILVRLPVKSLTRFKCVSKSWLSLISSPQFVRSHFSISSEPERGLNSQVLILPDTTLGAFYSYSPAGIKQISLHSALYEDDPSAHISDIVYPNREADPDPENSVVAIINGLVCLCVNSRFFLWNPALRIYKCVPISNVTRKEFSCCFFGFGYDKSNDDYKVVFLVSDDYRFGSDNVAVYSLLTDSWRLIGDYKGPLSLYFYGKYANGNIHWLVGSDPSNWKITSLDMVTDKFGELLLPEYEHGVSRMVFEVASERLYLLCKYGTKKTDFWVMENYGVHESWSKVVSIPYENHSPTESHMYEFTTPQVVCILGNGEIVLSDGWDFIVYNSKHKKFREIVLGVDRTSRFHVYVESMVSPKGLSAL